MEIRPYWIQLIQHYWEKKPIVWLAGVRRSGKTTLAKSIDGALFMNCDLPRVQRELEDIEEFMKLNRPEVLILDEVHRLSDPALTLKIIADEFPKTKVLATGSSTLTARKKFKDTLTDRKRTIHFTPALVSELELFGVTLKKRMLQGGLPPTLLAPTVDSDFFIEWFESFYSRDIQDVFEIDKKQPFLKLLELLLVRNGGMLEASEMAKLTGISRPTVVKYIEALEDSQAIHVIRPFHEKSEQEITHQPKVYGFDTGFVCHAKGWDTLRPEDRGLLFENIVLESMIASGLRDRVRYWRTKTREEIDFVLKLSRSLGVLAIEVKWSSKELSIVPFKKFREYYPEGENWIVCSDEERIRTVSIGKTHVKIVPILHFIKELERVTKI